jgi:8-oxo-dGTP diphosphatase
METRKITPAGVVNFMLSGNQFFLILRDNKPEISFPNMWSPVTGGIEKGETMFEAVERECLEEIAIIPKYLKILGVSAKGNGFFLSRLTEEERERIVLGEGQKYDFFSFEELAKIEIGGAFNIYLNKHKDVFKKNIRRN